MVDVGHAPCVIPMTADRLLWFTHVVLERIGSARSFSCCDPLVRCFVSLRLFVKGSLRRWWKALLPALFEILTICASLWFCGDGIVVGRQDLMNECPRFGSEFCSSTILIARYQTDEAASITEFCL